MAEQRKPPSYPRDKELRPSSGHEEDAPERLLLLGSKRRRLEIRHKLVAAVRDYFHSAGFLEVDTPLLLPTVAPESHIEPFVVDGGYLATSPELQMKELVAAGYPKVFQITRSFRRNEIGRRHSPEFAILEWYRPGHSVADLVHDVEALLPHVSRILAASPQALDGLLPRGRGADSPSVPPGLSPRGRGADSPSVPPGLSWQGRRVDLAPPYRATTVRDAFRRFVGRTPEECLADGTFEAELSGRVEPNLGVGAPECLHSYPTALGSLSRPDPSDPSVSQRVEIYVEGIELANGFVELADPTEQRLRFQQASEDIRSLGRNPPPVPERFLSSLARLPDCVGMALGLDRLAMLFSDASTISEVMAFGPGEA